MTLRLITVATEQVGPDMYQPMYRTLDCILPPDLNLEHRNVVGFEIIRDKKVEPQPEEQEAVEPEVITEENE